MTYDAWPAFPQVALRLPQEIADAQAAFAAFFKQRQPAKKLAWQPALDEVVFKFNACRVKGSAIFLAFLRAIAAGEPFEPAGVSPADVKMMGQILVKLGLVRRVGDSLAIVRKPPTRAVVTLPIPPSDSPRALAEQTMEDVAFSRTKKVEAALVLVMKRVRITDPATLFAEAAKVVHFVMTKKDFDIGLAACIEGLFLAKREEDGLIIFVPD
jgi:hypothetical protein